MIRHSGTYRRKIGLNPRVFRDVEFDFLKVDLPVYSALVAFPVIESVLARAVNDLSECNLRRCCIGPLELGDLPLDGRRWLRAELAVVVSSDFGDRQFIGRRGRRLRGKGGPEARER